MKPLILETDNVWTLDLKDIPAGYAVFCEKYTHRLALGRTWDKNLPRIVFIGLNPSTANEHIDDPTIRRVKRFAKDFGYGSLLMLNLFSFVTPYPTDLEVNKNLYTDTFYLDNVDADTVIFAWGNFKTHGRDEIVKRLFPNALCLGKNTNGSPKHPLYLRADVKPIKF
jgi:hypothetical protein